MYNGKRIIALIAAAGSGTRMGSSVPKQFLKIENKTLVEKSTEAFENNASVDDIYIVGAEEYLDELKKLPYSKIKGVVEGGKTRQESIRKGLEFIDGSEHIVLIHDAARPYVSTDLIDAVIASASLNKAAIPVIQVKDTVKKINENIITDTPDRHTLYSAQTPQGFNLDLIKKAHKDAYERDFTGTDDAQLIERAGHEVHTVPGEEQNIKITTREDLPESKKLVGLGFDVHAFAEDRDLILGGIKIPYDKGLQGHSDADVLTHALMDAILGAINMGDIGTNFPDTDNKYKDIRSIILLEKVRELMIEKGYTLENADLIIVAEKPKMKDYTKKMRETLAEALNTDTEIISIKATTTEGLGFTGREEGVGAQAIVQLVECRKETGVTK